MGEGFSKKFLSELLDSIPLVALVLDKNLRIIAGFGDYQNLLGKNKEELVGMEIEKLIPHKGLREILQRVKEQNKSKEFELSVHLPHMGSKILKGQTASLKALHSLLSSEEGKILFIEDITERTKLAEQLLQSEKTTGMGELAASIAHELGNPLSIMKSTLQFISDSMANKEGSIKEEVNVVLENIDRMHELLKNLTEFTVPEKPAFSYGNLHEGISRILAFVHRECKSKGIEIKTNLDETIPPLWMDMRRMKQVLLNLIKNAIEAMPEGGTLTICTRLVDTFHFAPSEKVIITIQDTGRGIPHEEIHKVFNPFYSTKKGGCGLGLPIARKVIREHQGKLTVESIQGRGTAFTIKIPASEGNGEKAKVDHTNSRR